MLLAKTFGATMIAAPLLLVYSVYPPPSQLTISIYVPDVSYVFWIYEIKKTITNKYLLIILNTNMYEWLNCNISTLSL